MIQEAHVTVFFEERLPAKNGVHKQKNKILSMQTESVKKFWESIFMNATYEGDLMTQAGVSYTIGRKATAQYGERLNSVQTSQAIYHQFNQNVYPYIVPGDVKSGFLHGIDPSGPGAENNREHRVQTYNYRPCITDAANNQIPFTKPADHDQALFELLQRHHEAGDTRLPLAFIMIPNRKIDINNNFAVKLPDVLIDGLARGKKESPGILVRQVHPGDV